MNTIVIVDNGPEIEEITPYLAAWGYRVIPISEPEEIRQIDGDNPLNIDLVILNIDRPDQNVRDILRALKLPFPLVKIILISASYNRQTFLSDFLPKAFCRTAPAFLTIPCTEQELLDAVREQLGESLLNIWAPS